MSWKRLGVGSVAFALAVIGAGACSSSGGGKTVSVSAVDYKLTPETTSVPAGDVTFKVKNNGTFVHEMVVVKVGSASELPTKSNGEADEDKIPEAKKIDEVEDIDPGTTKSLKVKLEAGKYQLFCNKVDGATSHFEKGMHTDFTVTK